MRALFVVRPDLERFRGGDTTQILATARALNDLGVEVEIVDQVPASLAGFDIVHLFHLDRLWENVPHLRAVGGRRPVVLSPIWWPKDEYNAHSRRGVQGAISRAVGTRLFDSMRLAVRSFVAFKDSPSVRTVPRPSAWMFLRRARELLGASAVVLPNSLAEVRRLEEGFGVEFPYVVVPNGVDPAGPQVPDTVAYDGEEWIDVLCVARLEPRKNQLKLIEALGDTDLTVAFAGASGRYDTDYETMLREAAGERMSFLGPVAREHLPGLYRSARVHVLPSWFETPGLSSLEAASHGCRVVVGNCEPVREYFGEHAVYCDPASVDSIRDAVRRALDTSDDELAAVVNERFTWPAAAKATVDAYEQAMGSWSRP